MKLIGSIVVFGGSLVAQTQAPPPAQTASPAGSVVFNLPDAPLPELIDVLAKRMKINYILDPRVKGSVILRVYGEFKAADLRGLLETILRVNGAALVQVGDLFRIVPISDVVRLPLQPRLVVQEEGEQVTESAMRAKQ